MEVIKAIKNKHAKRLLKKANVVAVGVGLKNRGGKIVRNQPCVVVSVVEKVPRSDLHPADLVPEALDGVVTDVVATGKIKALAHTNRLRPAVPGISLGHVDITAGTFGAVVYGFQPLILSNNHVMANSNKAQVGDPILQPGPIDRGTVGGDKIATLSDFVPIEFMEGNGGLPKPDCPVTPAVARVFNALAEILGRRSRLIATAMAIPREVVNLVDCAVAAPLELEMINSSIIDIGVPGSPVEAEVGMDLMKSGRTTEYTEGEVMQIDVTATVDYGGPIALFEQQIMSGAMSAGGDSGSLVMAKSGANSVGLLFAGSDQVTIMNPIQAVLDALGVKMVVS